jgi:hypothetical protein
MRLFQRDVRVDADPRGRMSRDVETSRPISEDFFADDAGAAPGCSGQQGIKKNRLEQGDCVGKLRGCFREPLNGGAPVLVGVLARKLKMALIGPCLGQEFRQVSEVLALVEFRLYEIVSALDV